MGKVIYLLVFLFLAVACASQHKDLNRFTRMDSLTTVTRVNCGSNEALSCMACALQGEAADQPGPGVYAVAKTIMTRAKGKVSRICPVTKASGQFEGMKKRGHRKISRKVWQIAQKIMATRETGWTHFWAPKAQNQLRRSIPHWIGVYKKRGCESAQIGDHEFFNTKNCRYKRMPAGS